MKELFGIVLAWGGCAVWGMCASAGLRRRTAVLTDIGQALEGMERELVLNRTALPELLEHAARRNTREGKQLFLSCFNNIEKGISFTHAWDSALKESGVAKEEQALLGSLGQLLGHYDAMEQSRGLSCLRSELERRTNRSRQEALSLGQVYRVLGVTAGGFLVLTLL